MLQSVALCTQRARNYVVGRTCVSASPTTVGACGATKFDVAAVAHRTKAAARSRLNGHRVGGSRASSLLTRGFEAGSAATSTATSPYACFENERRRSVALSLLDWTSASKARLPYQLWPDAPAALRETLQIGRNLFVIGTESCTYLLRGRQRQWRR